MMSHTDQDVLIDETTLGEYVSELPEDHVRGKSDQDQGWHIEPNRQRLIGAIKVQGVQASSSYVPHGSRRMPDRQQARRFEILMREIVKSRSMLLATRNAVNRLTAELQQEQLENSRLRARLRELEGRLTGESWDDVPLKFEVPGHRLTAPVHASGLSKPRPLILAEDGAE